MWKGRARGKKARADDNGKEANYVERWMVTSPMSLQAAAWDIVVGIFILLVFGMTVIALLELADKHVSLHL